MQVIGRLPDAAAACGDVSVHICFVCLLHLANEKSLRLDTHGQLGSLGIHMGEGAGTGNH